MSKKKQLPGPVRALLAIAQGQPFSDGRVPTMKQRMDAFRVILQKLQAPPAVNQSPGRK